MTIMVKEVLLVVEIVISFVSHCETRERCMYMCGIIQKHD